MPAEITGILSHRLSTEDVAIAPTILDKRLMRDYALAHEKAGFDRVLITQSSFWPDSMPIASYLADVTEQLGSIAAHRPGFVSPTVAARLSAALDQLSDGRAAIHVITAANDREPDFDGDFLTNEERYHRSREFADVPPLDLVIYRTGRVDYAGDDFRFANTITACRRPAARAK